MSVEILDNIEKENLQISQNHKKSDDHITEANSEKKPTNSHVSEL